MESLGKNWVTFEEAAKLPYQLHSPGTIWNTDVEWCVENCKKRWGWHFAIQRNYHPRHGDPEATTAPWIKLGAGIFAFEDRDDMVKFRLSRS